MIKTRFKYNEIEYAKHILEHGFYTRFHPYELKVLVKYWKHVGMKPKQRIEALYSFCEKHIIDFDRALYYKLINSTMAYSSKKTSIPIVVESILIYEHEFTFFNTLPIEDSYKKIMLTLLIEKKIHKEIYKIMNQESSDDGKISPYLKSNKKLYKSLKESSKIPNKLKMTDVIYELYQLEYVTVLERGMIRLDFIETLNEMKSDKLIDIKSFDDIGHYYDLLSGDKKIGFCDDCNGIIKKRANNQIRCKDCTEIHRKKYIAQKVKEHKQKSKHSEMTL